MMNLFTIIKNKISKPLRICAYKENEHVSQRINKIANSKQLEWSMVAALLNVIGIYFIDRRYDKEDILKVEEYINVYEFNTQILKKDVTSSAIRLVDNLSCYLDGRPREYRRKL